MEHSKIRPTLLPTSYLFLCLWQIDLASKKAWGLHTIIVCIVCIKLIGREQVPGGGLVGKKKIANEVGHEPQGGRWGALKVVCVYFVLVYMPSGWQDFTLTSA